MVRKYITQLPFVPGIMYRLYSNNRYMHVETLAMALDVEYTDALRRIDGDLVINKVQGSSRQLKLGYVHVCDLEHVLRRNFGWTDEDEIAAAMDQVANPVYAIIGDDDDDDFDVEAEKKPQKVVRKRPRLEDLARKVDETRTAILELRRDIARSIQATKDEAMQAYVESAEFKLRLQAYIRNSKDSL